MEQCFSFDDVLMIPEESHVLPSEAKLKTNLTRKIQLNIPLISAAMDTVTGTKMAIALALAGGIGVIHRNLPIEIQAEKVKLVKAFDLESKYDNASLDEHRKLRVAAAVGTSEADIARTEKLLAAGVDAIVVDTAHGHSAKVKKVIIEIKKLLSSQSLIVGNVATLAAADYLIEAGVDAVKVGIGPGSICTTRIIAGIGIPQFSAIQNVAKACSSSGVCLIADGGIKSSGDIAKAIGAGAHTVMIGSLFAGTDESLGELVEHNGKQYKSYRGMGSMSAIKDGSYERYFQSDKVSSGKLYILSGNPPTL